MISHKKVGKTRRFKCQWHFIWRQDVGLIDEEAALYSIVQLENSRVVTKYISEINFMNSAKQGDIVEIGIDVVKFEPRL